MSKGLEAYYKLCWLCKKAGVFNYEQGITNANIIEKELKALEIIKKKLVNVSHLVVETLDYYNSMWEFEGGEKYQLTHEEYDLLKEVLLCKD